MLALTIGLKANTVNHELGHLDEELATKRMTKQQVVVETQSKKDLLHSLRPDGYPFPRIMDTVTDAVADKAGLTAVTLEPGGKLIINGDAANEKTVIQTLENLKRCRFFESASMESFDRLVPLINHAPLVRFTLACQLAGAKPVITPGSH